MNKSKKQNGRSVAARNVHRDEGRAIPMTPAMRVAMERQFKAFEKKFGRPPGPNDPVFFDPDASTPQPIDAQKMMQDAIETMRSINIDPALIYAYEKTGGLMVTSANQHLLSAEDVEEWEAAINEYRCKRPEQYADETGRVPAAKLDLHVPMSGEERDAWDRTVGRSIEELDPDLAGKVEQYIAEAQAEPSTCSGCARPVDAADVQASRLCWLCENKRERSCAPIDNPYAGESDAKRVQRVLLYTRVQELLDAYGDPGGWAVVLAGPDAAEVGVLRYMLAWPRDRVIFVDRDEEGLRAAETKWPGVDTFHGDVADILTALRGGIGFAHFDFMGHVNKTVTETFQIAREKIVPNGIVAYTYLRGRETPREQAWATALRVGRSRLMEGKKFAERRRLRNDHIALNEAARTYGYMALMAAALSSRGFDEYAPIYTSRYHSGRSPMGLFAMTRTPVSQRDHRWKAIGGTTEDHLAANRDWDEAVKCFAVEMRKKVPDEEIAAILNIDAKSLAAWQAHLTRGTYSKENPPLKERSMR